MPKATKSLIINDIVFAEYIIEDDIIYLKMIRKVIPENDLVSENLLISIVQSVENATFTRAAYLNN